MAAYKVRVAPEAINDLDGVFRYVWSRSGSSGVALNYLARIERFLNDLQHIPKRGSLRNDVRPGLRVIGFERSVSIGFIVEKDEVVILRVLAGGRKGLLED